ncbi:hypothetical protein SDC9_152102 [bioreactor metagenome]|uniref:Uncharacterized protein n=1 Tax=bioreactor metagenome TaxID=1076179 RepID=A0A645EWM0_9ZZZZ
MCGRLQTHVFGIIQRHIGETLPVDDIDQVGGDVDNTFTLLFHIIIPGRTDQGISRNILIKMMHTFHINSGICCGSVFQNTEKFPVAHQFFFHDIQNIITLGHQVVKQNVIFLGNGKRFFQLFKLIFIDGHGFIGQHIVTGLHRLADVVRFLPVVPGQHHHIAFFVRQHF